jgi:hypothetical protein
MIVDEKELIGSNDKSNELIQLPFTITKSKSKNMEMDLSTIQCYKCRKMGHYSSECLNLLALSTRENMGSSIRRFFAKEKGKT